MVSLIAWFQSFRVLERGPRAAQFSQQIVSVVNITRASLLYSRPDKRHALLSDLAKNEGVRIYALEGDDQYAPVTDLNDGWFAGRLFEDSTFWKLVERQVRNKLGDKTHLASQVNGLDGLWVNFFIANDGYWVEIARDRLDNAQSLQWIGWGLFALVLSLLGAAWITGLVNHPLARLSESAQALSKGQKFKPLPERGPLEVRQANTSFNQMAEELQRVEYERTTMLAGISHDLRTPLTRMAMEIELTPADENAKLALHSDIEQMNAIIGQFLHYARPDSMKMETLDLNAIINETSARFDAVSDVLFFTRLREDIPDLMGDPVELKRLITNLIENARKYAKKDPLNPVFITIGTRYIERSDQIEMIFFDDGPGVPEEDLERISHPFVRGNEARTQDSMFGDDELAEVIPGTGLGLAIVERIVKSHRGRWALSNRPEAGLQITIRFPTADTAGF